MDDTAASSWKARDRPESLAYLVSLDKVLLEDMGLVYVANVAPESLLVLILEPAHRGGEHAGAQIEFPLESGVECAHGAEKRRARSNELQ